MTTALTVTHVDITDWILVALSSGFAAAVFNQLIGGLLAKFQRSSDQRHQEALQDSRQQFEERMQKDARENESLQLLIKSHFKQRDKLLEAATASYNWVNYEIYRNYGMNYDVYAYNEPVPEGNEADTIASLRLITQTHPTRSVRSLARQLTGSMSRHYSSITSYRKDPSGKREIPEIGETPTEDQLFEWLKQCGTLIELMHTPPTLDEVRPSSNTMASAAMPVPAPVHTVPAPVPRFW